MKVKRIVNENGLVRKSGTDVPYKKSRTNPPTMISYPGATTMSNNEKNTVAYHGNMNALRKNIIVKIILYTITVQL